MMMEWKKKKFRYRLKIHKHIQGKSKIQYMPSNKGKCHSYGIMSHYFQLALL